jgi:hypothetical protein
MPFSHELGMAGVLVRLLGKVYLVSTLALSSSASILRDLAQAMCVTSCSFPAETRRCVQVSKTDGSKSVARGECDIWLSASEGVDGSGEGA